MWSLLVLLPYRYLVVALDEVELAEDGGAVEVVSQVLHVEQGVPVGGWWPGLGACSLRKVAIRRRSFASCGGGMTRRSLSSGLYLTFPVAEIQLVQGPVFHCPTCKLWKKWAYLWSQCVYG